MSIISISSIALIGISLILIVRGVNREFAVFISMAISVVLLTFVLYHLQSILQFLKGYFDIVNGGELYFSILIKIMITAYIADFTAQVCKDAGENAIADKVELAGKVVIFITASPVIVSVMELISHLISF